MGRPRLDARFVIVAALALAACAKSESMAPDAGEAGAPSGTCQQIRICVFGAPCADAACVAACAAKGSADARAAFEALRACTAKTCATASAPGFYAATADVNCACGEQCQAGGSCLQEADTCLGTATVDDICDTLCA